jgi:hypothetical protein
MPVMVALCVLNAAAEDDIIIIDDFNQETQVVQQKATPTTPQTQTVQIKEIPAALPTQVAQEKVIQKTPPTVQEKATPVIPRIQAVQEKVIPMTLPVVEKSDVNFSRIVDRAWECSSRIKAFNTDIKLFSRDIYYFDGTYESKPTISIKSPSVYSNVITFDNAATGSWRAEGGTLTTTSGGETDTVFISKFANNRFVTKSSNGLERTCNLKTVTFSPEVLAANSWKCAFNEDLGTPDTYIKMESVNKYSSNGTGEVDGVIKLKLDRSQPELSYSIAYSEKWSYKDGRFKTQTDNVRIKNLTSESNSNTVLEEMASLESIFKNDVVDEMEVVLLEEDAFILQDLSHLGKERSKYSCKRVENDSF